MLSVALCGCTGSSADRGELEQRLRQVSKDARLETPVGGATFREAERVLCFPSEPPYVVFRYAYSGPFADVASFYRGLLARSGWRHDHPAEFEQRHDGWTARLFVEDNTTPRDPSDPVGYDLRVTVDDGVPARRKSWPGEQCGQSEWVPLVGDDAWQEFLGTLACYQGIAGDYDRAKIDAQAATEAARRVGSPSAFIMAAHARAWAYRRDDLEFAIQSAEEAVATVESGGIFATNAAGIVALAGGLVGPGRRRPAGARAAPPRHRDRA